MRKVIFNFVSFLFLFVFLLNLLSVFSAAQDYSAPGLYQNTKIQNDTQGTSPGTILPSFPIYGQKCPPNVEKCPYPEEQGKETSFSENATGDVSEVSETVEKAAEEELYRIKDSGFIEGETVGGVYYYVMPERTTVVRLSNIDINRIVCPVNVQDVVYSEEKGVKIHVSGRNVFVKFLVKKVGDRTEFSKTPVDIHVVCNNKVFSIIGVPQKIPAVLIYLEDKEAFLKKKLYENRNKSFEERLLEVVKNLFSGKVPYEADYRIVNREYDIFKDIKVVEKAEYIFEGEGFIAKYFELENIGNSTYDLSEKMFLKKELTKRPLAISLEKLKIRSGERISMVIIEKDGGF